MQRGPGSTNRSSDVLPSVNPPGTGRSETTEPAVMDPATEDVAMVEAATIAPVAESDTDAARADVDVQGGGQASGRQGPSSRATSRAGEQNLQALHCVRSIHVSLGRIRLRRS